MSRRRPTAGTAPRARTPTVRHHRARSDVSEPASRAPARRATSRARKEPRARAGRTRSRRVYRALLVVAIALSVLAVGGDWLIRQSYLRVQHVTFVGLRHERTASVLAASGLNRAPPMIDVSASSIEHRLAGFVWIASVDVAKHWPNSLVVTVHERVPVAVAFGAAHVLRFVDASGHELGPAPLHENLPTLVYQHPRAATWPFTHAGRAAAYVASQLPRAFASQVSVISVDAAGSVSLKMTTPVTFVLGPASQLKAKFVSIASVIAHARLTPGDIVDVTVPGSLAVTGGPPS